MRIFSVGDIETAINYWRARSMSNESYGLCEPARVLADIYGRMIFDRSEAVPESALNEQQRAAAVAALDQAELPL